MRKTSWYVSKLSNQKCSHNSEFIQKETRKGNPKLGFLRTPTWTISNQSYKQQSRMEPLTSMRNKGGRCFNKCWSMILTRTNKPWSIFREILMLSAIQVFSGWPHSRTSEKPSTSEFTEIHLLKFSKLLEKRMMTCPFMSNCMAKEECRNMWPKEWVRS